MTQDQLAEWKAAGGYQRSEWDQFKVELAGSMDAFNNWRLQEPWSFTFIMPDSTSLFEGEMDQIF